MKFTSVFIAFNIIILFFLLLVCGLPVIFFKSWSFGDFWSITWPAVVFLLVILIGPDGFYFINRRLFQLLEKEDWPALVRYLEERIFKEGRYTRRLVRLLANTYLILSDSASVTGLENKTAIAKPALVDANALIFGTARILGKDTGGAAAFFFKRLNSAKTESADWVHWYYGFSLLLDRQFSAAGDQFKTLAAESKDGIITGLSAFFLAENLNKAVPQRSLEFTAAAMEGRNRLKKTFPTAASWNREVKKILNEVYTVVLSKYINEAALWLFGNSFSNPGS
ncbi:MAG: hypothetical protein LBG08_03325 [Spirochaetaceae bacterium]|nr:hypothetical protein [Spirochaetaceae bacterium]